MGLTITTGSPCAARRKASSSASCLEFTYAMPRWPISKGVVSSAAPFGFATPIAPALEVWTSRLTPASSASSKTTRAPRRLAAKTASRSALRSDVRPAT